jgi:hypothetical protein
MRQRLRTLMAVACVAAAPVVYSQPPDAPKEIRLWPEGVPGAIANAAPEQLLPEGRIAGVQVPTLTAFPAPAAVATRTAVIVCPGGAYRRLAFDHEGIAVANWLNSLSVSAFVLK